MSRYSSLAEDDVDVATAVFRWVQRFTPLLIDAARPCRHAPGDRWFVDETFVKIAGRWVYLYRAIDQFGQVIDVLVSEKRDLAATRRFFTRALQHGLSPVEVTTDRAVAYVRVLDELVPAACHITEQYRNNPIEADHGRLSHDCGRCEGSNSSAAHESLVPDMRSSRTSAAATTNSVPRKQQVYGSGLPSTSWPW
jgi:transposase-like protein